MAIDKIINQNTINSAVSKISNKINPYAASLGDKFEKSKISDIFSKYMDPRGGNNTFPVLAALMLCVGITPRFLAAAKRNPDNKEATKDELKEIFFRDIQTAAVLLLLLKPLNAVIAAIATKKTGLPMTNKPFEKLFDESIEGFSEKAKYFIKNLGKNIIDAINPIGGIAAKTNKEHIADYSNYTFENFPKLLEKIENEKGDKEKIFNEVLDGIVEKYKNILNGASKKQYFGLKDRFAAGVNNKGQILDSEQRIANIQKTIDELEVLKQKGVNELDDIIKKEDNENIKTAFTNYLKDEDNSLLKKAKGLNGWLRSIALAFEICYLGFGIPALNQRRLEKKYLKNNQENDSFDRSNGSLILKNIKANQIKLYHDFIK